MLFRGSHLRTVQKAKQLNHFRFRIDSIYNYEWRFTDDEFACIGNPPGPSQLWELLQNFNLNY